ncbi:MAG: hypothetical protein RBR16_09545 [Syntrophus sp. (in: bacteria)]|nr:hypothetical protein [Syntrophus sp. (in: bacteria)]
MLTIEPKVRVDPDLYHSKMRYVQPVIIIRNLSQIDIVSSGAYYQLVTFSKSKKKFVWQEAFIADDPFFKRQPLYEKKLEQNSQRTPGFVQTHHRQKM